jgi:ketosteroid isomerase-like protein
MGKVARFSRLERSARAANERFVTAILRGDPSAAAAGYARGARLLAPSAAVIEGRDRIEAFWRAGIEAGIRAVERSPFRIDAHGSVGIEIGRYSIRLEPATGGEVVDRGTYLLVHERGADATWAWTLEMFTPEGAPQVASGPAAAGGLEVGEAS